MSGDKLPPGWTRTTLGQLGRYMNGRAFKKSEWSPSGRPIVRIQNLTGTSSDFNHFDGQLEERHVAQPGDLLVSWAATLGAHIWQGPEAAVNQHIFKVESFIDLRFHKYVIDHALAELSRYTHGSGIVHVTRGRFDSVPVLLPPLDEQQRIVAVLEDQFSRLNAGASYITAARLRSEKLIAAHAAHSLLGNGPNLAIKRQAVVRDAGPLPELPARWRWSRLADVAEVVGGVTKDAGKQHAAQLVEVPYLRVANVQRGRLDLAEVKTIRVPGVKAEALRLIPGDVLLNEGGDRDKLGRGWVWSGEVDDCIHQNHVFRARVRDALRPKLLSWWANTVGGEWCDQHGRQSVNLASISLSRIRQMPVPVPPGSAQEAIEAGIGEVHDAAARLDVAMTASAVRGASLRGALLTAAFAGRL